MDGRRFSEKELAEILRSAALAQTESQGHAVESSGYTLDEIEQLAAEVGIDPKRIAAAAESLPVASNDASKFRFWGAPIRQTFERTINGTFNDPAWEEMVADLRDRYGYNGTASVVGSSLEWSGGNDFRAVHLSLTPKNGKTRVRIAMRTMEVVVLTWMATFVFGFMLCAMSGALITRLGYGTFAPIWIIGVIATLWFLAHRFLVGYNARETAGIDEVVASMARAVQASKPEPLVMETSANSGQPTSLSQSVSN